MSETKAAAATADTPDNVRPIDRAKEQMSEAVDKTKAAAREGLSQAREKLSDISGHVSAQAKRYAEDMKESAGRAGTVARERYSEVSEQVRDRYAHTSEQVRDRYAHTSEQVREGYGRVRHDLDDRLADTNDYIRENPGKAVLIAAGIGFLFGLMFRRRELD